ncbi:hypothetical protein [Bradyrhizobium sp. McL0616]|uniref:hypothetical protein n=1 Tax=Bradyrhizobium sp. McL0616 TaxID=3415674 RepID=UPI003CE8772D
MALDQIVDGLSEVANDGIVDQKAVHRYAQNCYKIIEELDSFGIRFLKNENGDYAVKKVHHITARKARAGA